MQRLELFDGGFIREAWGVHSDQNDLYNSISLLFSTLFGVSKPSPEAPRRFFPQLLAATNVAFSKTLFYPLYILITVVSVPMCVSRVIRRPDLFPDSPKERRQTATCRRALCELSARFIRIGTTAWKDTRSCYLFSRITSSFCSKRYLNCIKSASFSEIHIRNLHWNLHEWLKNIPAWNDKHVRYFAMTQKHVIYQSRKK